MTPSTRLVWDLPLRLFHWLLAVSVLASWLTGELGSELRPVHMALGYWMVGLLSFRFLWGVIGSRHARFASFLPRPRALLGHARSLLRGEAYPTAGHDPLGSLMVYAILLMLALQAGSGLFIEDDIMHAGPLRELVTAATAEVLSDVHHTIGELVVWLAGLHVVAVLYYVFRHRLPLIRAMITGRKDASLVTAGDAISGTPWRRAIVAVALAAAIVFAIVA